MAVIVRLVQQFQPAHKQEFHVLEKQFAELELRGLLPRGERLVPISGREPGNTIVWQGRFDSLAEAEKALKRMEDCDEHTELAKKQHPMFQQSWVEFYEVLPY
jgi:hypothetical protein